MGGRRIDQMSREEKRAIQRDLIRLGFLDPLLPGGDPADDGIWGPVTDAAYSAYWASRPQVESSVPIVTPAPVMPWWRTRRAKGALTAIAGLGALFIPALREVDIAYLIELIWSNLEHVESIITAVGALVALGGTIWSAIGSAKAAAPIDSTLIARVAGHDVRVPRLRRDRVPAASGSEPRDPFGHFGE